MDERLLDYHNYDKLNLFVRNDRADKLIKIYKELGYDLVSFLPNKRYHNIVDITFVRPHKIKNKNELQYLQVGLEIELNKIGKLENRKYSTSMIFGLSFGVISVILISWGCYFLFGSIDNNLPLSIVSFVFGALGCMLEILFLPKIIKKEKINFKKKNEECNLKLDKIFCQIKKINKGEKNGK